jgi:hypothetical protein
MIESVRQHAVEVTDRAVILAQREIRFAGPVEGVLGLPVVGEIAQNPAEYEIALTYCPCLKAAGRCGTPARGRRFSRRPRTG